MNLTKACKLSRVLNGVVAGTTSQNSSVVDTTGFDSTTFVALFGALTATQTTSIRVQGGTLPDGSDMTDLLGTKSIVLADTDNNKVLAVEVISPRERYLRCVVTRGVANSVVDGVLCLQTWASKEPVTHDTSIAGVELHASPAEGTA